MQSKDFDTSVKKTSFMSWANSIVSTIGKKSILSTETYVKSALIFQNPTFKKNKDFITVIF